ncbi:hypothetical protein [Bradyrhizobium sp. NC92]|uniref:hypothetical protein n=1 Tax=Bradyrhizobium sp. (strain NC92) TaxID=55395 RepID=UPI0021A9C9F7|nr:hypothetical protein [Bradyrhizobium sp. NC92]UWU66096.1 hypothetical protein N2602_22870 [Bradyrhizobium sp. NC92]
MRPTESTLKRLFALSGNRCPFPNCPATLTYNGRLIGEVCHIKGDNPGAARYDPAQTDKERQAYENLIAMCPTHHTVIDDDEESYPVYRILKMKADHEAKASPMTDADAESAAGHFLEIGYANIDQSGGIAAQHFQAHTVNLHSAPTDPVAQARRLQAVETLWKAIKDLGNEFGQLVHVETIFTAEEIDGFFRNGWPRGYRHIAEYADDQAIITRFERARAREVESERLFVPQRVWSAYFIIRALYGRSAYLFQKSFEEHSYRNWRSDSGVNQLLQAILPPNVVEQLKAQQIAGLHKSFDHLEEQFLAEANVRA